MRNSRLLLSFIAWLIAVFLTAPIDAQTKEVLAFYRNWEPGDEARKPIQHLFEFPFVTWDGAYSIDFCRIKTSRPTGEGVRLRLALFPQPTARSRH